MPYSASQFNVRRSVLISLIGNGLAGTAGTAVALYPLNTTPAVVGFLRLIIGAATLLILAPLAGGKLKSIPKLLSHPPIWIMGVTAASYQAFFFASVERTGVATAALITVGCIPASAGVVGWLVLRERPNNVWFIATTIGIAGLTIRSLGELKVNDAAGLIFAIIAGTGIGFYLTAAKIEVRKGGHPMLLPGTAYAIGSLGLLALVHTDLLKVTWNTSAVLVALFIGVVTMGVANALQIIGMRGLTPGVAATMMLSDPVGAAILGVVVLHEAVTLQGSIGFVLVVTGLALQSYSPGNDDK